MLCAYRAINAAKPYNNQVNNRNAQGEVERNTGTQLILTAFPIQRQPNYTRNPDMQNLSW